VRSNSVSEMVERSSLDLRYEGYRLGEIGKGEIGSEIGTGPILTR